jgi:5'-3' exonuclease
MYCRSCIFKCAVRLILFSSCIVLISGGVVGLTRFFSKMSTAWSPPEINSIKDVDHLCIDMNQVIHSCIRSKTPTALQRNGKRIYSELDSILSSVFPKKSLVLVFDGPAPFAKLQTLRSLRSSS